MKATGGANLAAIFGAREEEILEAWMREQLRASTWRPDLISEAELRTESTEFLRLLVAALQGPVASNGHGGNGDGAISSRTLALPGFDGLKALLDRVSGTRAQAGFTPASTATFVFSVKEPLFAVLQDELGDDPTTLFAAVWSVTTLLDAAGLYTTDAFQAGREAVIRRQQQELLELSTPVVKLWDGILALPLIGTLDSSRTQTVMESLLSEIVRTGSTIAIVDITGVETVDTLVAQHLLKTVAAARLMGADCIISGIRPQIARMVVELAIDLSNVTTKATLADALGEAYERLGLHVSSA